MDDLEDAVDGEEHLLLGVFQRGAERPRAKSLADRLEDRLEIVQALGVDHRGDLGVPRGSQHVAPKLDELCPALAQSLDQSIRWRRTGFGEAAGRFAELGPEVEEALGQRSEVTAKIVEFCVHFGRQGRGDSRNSGRRVSNSKRDKWLGFRSKRGQGPLMKGIARFGSSRCFTIADSRS